MLATQIYITLRASSHQLVADSHAQHTMARRVTPSSRHTASTHGSRRSADSYESRSTALTSVNGSPRPSVQESTPPVTALAPLDSCSAGQDLSPSTSLYPRSSVDTYSSCASLGKPAGSESDGALDDYPEIPALPLYRHEITDTTVRPTTPEDFAHLFPSLDRLAIKHDDFTLDGNMNLRVDTAVPGRQGTMQLFHLRMYDLQQRDFSLRRYCRESGREVCNAKRKYAPTAADGGRPGLQRSVSTAMKNLARPPFLRAATGASALAPRIRPGTSGSSTGEPEAADDDNDSCCFSCCGEHAGPAHHHQPPRPRSVATNAIKLEFSNYARVDVARCGTRGATRYEFEWWGRKYAWRKVTDKLTDVVSYHLFRDGQANPPVAHIVPETRSPNQVADDERAGGWIPPCHMWLSDDELVHAMTDVAE